MAIILYVILSVAVTLFVVYLSHRLIVWRTRYWEMRGTCEESLDRLIEAEKDLEKSDGELKFLKELFNRPLVATLSDAQAGNLTQAVLAYLGSLQKDPNSLN